MKFRVFIVVLIVVVVLLGVAIYYQLDALMNASQPVLDIGDKK